MKHKGTFRRGCPCYLSLVFYRLPFFAEPFSFHFFFLLLLLFQYARLHRYRDSPQGFLRVVKLAHRFVLSPSILISFPPTPFDQSCLSEASGKQKVVTDEFGYIEHLRVAAFCSQQRERVKTGTVRYTGVSPGG